MANRAAGDEAARCGFLGDLGRDVVIAAEANATSRHEKGQVRPLAICLLELDDLGIAGHVRSLWCWQGVDDDVRRLVPVIDAFTFPWAT